MNSICKNCLSIQLKKWADLHPAIDIESMDEFVNEIYFHISLYLKRMNQYECHKKSKNNGFKSLEKDIRRIQITINSINKNPILNASQREFLVKPIKKAEKQLNKTLSKCNFDRWLFTVLYTDNKEDAQSKLVIEGKINRKIIRNTFIVTVAESYKKATNRKNILRTSEENKNSLSSPFQSLIKNLYENELRLFKDDNTIRKDISNALR